MALIDLKTDLSKRIGSKGSPQTFTDGHSSTIVTGQKTFEPSIRHDVTKDTFTAYNRKGKELKYQYDQQFTSPSLLTTTAPKLQKYYDRAFKDTDPLGARNNDVFGFDQPFIVRGIGDRWGGKYGSVDIGLIRAGAVTQAARTVADVQRIGQFLVTPRGLGFILKQEILQSMNAGGGFITNTVAGMINKKLGVDLFDAGARPQLWTQGVSDPTSGDWHRFRTTKGGAGTRLSGGGLEGSRTNVESAVPLQGSDIRSYRPASLIGSLPMGAHLVRHKVPSGTARFALPTGPSVSFGSLPGIGGLNIPSFRLGGFGGLTGLSIGNISQFVIDLGDGGVVFADGLQIAYPYISINPSFRSPHLSNWWPHIGMAPTFKAGKILTGIANFAGEVVAGVKDIGGMIGQAGVRFRGLLREGGAQLGEDFGNLADAIGRTLSAGKAGAQAVGEWGKKQWNSMARHFPQIYDITKAKLNQWSDELRDFMGGLGAMGKSFVKGAYEAAKIGIRDFHGGLIPSLYDTVIGDPIDLLVSVGKGGYALGKEAVGWMAEHGTLLVENTGVAARWAYRQVSAWVDEFGPKIVFKNHGAFVDEMKALAKQAAQWVGQKLERGLEILKEGIKGWEWPSTEGINDAWAGIGKGIKTVVDTIGGVLKTAYEIGAEAVSYVMTPVIFHSKQIVGGLIDIAKETARIPGHVFTAMKDAGMFNFDNYRSFLPSIDFHFSYSGPDVKFDLGNFRLGAKWRTGFITLIKEGGIRLPDIPAWRIGSRDKVAGGGSRRGGQSTGYYGIDVSTQGGALDAGLGGAPNSYYTIAQTGISQDSQSGLSGELQNPFRAGESYEHALWRSTLDRDNPFYVPMGIQIPVGGGTPFVTYHGFEQDIFASFPMYTKLTLATRAANKSLGGKYIKNKVEDHPRLGKLQRYEMLSYGQLGLESNKYGENTKHINADMTRKLGTNSPSLPPVDHPEFGIISRDSTGKVHGGITQDHVNLHPYGGSTLSDKYNDRDDDFVPFKFRDMVNGKWIIFRAILESISDTSSPEYAEDRYIGRPENVYTYKGSTRNVNVSFKVMPKSIQELVTIWDKINYLRGLTYPSIENNRMIAPFASITIGDMFNKLPVLMQSLNLAIDTASTWEIKPGLRLPKLLQVSADMRVVEPVLPQTTGKHYSLDWLKGGQKYGTFSELPSKQSSTEPTRTGYLDLWSEVHQAENNQEIKSQLRSSDADIDALNRNIDAVKTDLLQNAFDIPNIANFSNGYDMGISGIKKSFFEGF